MAGFGVLRQTVVAPDDSATAFGEIVSGDYFSVLGVNAVVGRTLQPQDDRPDAPLVAMLEYGAWQRLFGGESDAVGRTIRMGGRLFEVVGVVPADFRGLFNGGRG